MGIVKKIIYYLRLLIAIGIFALTIAIAISYLTGNNFLNLPFDEIIGYIVKDPVGITLKFLGILAIITLVMGRIWCSLICPVGTFQEIIWIISRRTNEKRPSYFYKYIFLLITAIVLYFFHSEIINYISTHKTAVILTGTVVMFLIALLTIFKGRFFCSDICPFGALYGLISKFSILKIHQGKNCMYCSMCEEVCPTGCIDVNEEYVNNVTCVKCLRCFNTCSDNGMNYGIKFWKH